MTVLVTRILDAKLAALVKRCEEEMENCTRAVMHGQAEDTPVQQSRISRYRALSDVVGWATEIQKRDRDGTLED